MSLDIDSVNAMLDAAADRAGGAESIVRRSVSQQAPEDPLAALSRFLVTEDQVQDMKATRLIWRNMIAETHLAAWCAPAGAGKTSVALLAAAELAPTFKVLYFQEDAPAGDLPALHEHATEHGYHLLNSTLANGSPNDQVDVLDSLVRAGVSLQGYVLFLDTLKKYTDLMSKGGARDFLQLMRALTQRGATIVLLGHTNKHRGPDGKLIFEGVGDVRNDVDELLYFEATEKDPRGTVTVTVTPDKVRCAIEKASFEIDTFTRSVRPMDSIVDVAALVAAERRQREDAELIQAVTQELRAGGLNYTELLTRVIRATGKSKTQVREVIERYCTEDPADESGLWVETRMRLNNVRHISLPPRGIQ